MAQDEVSLYNLALSVAGARGRISLPAEASREAEICRLWYEPVRRQVLRSAPWSSTKAVAQLALLNEQDNDTWAPGEPGPGYRFAYGLPAGCLRPRYLYDYSHFEIALLSPSQQAVMTNNPNPLLYYTLDQTLISQWDASLYLAIAHALGAFIALPLNGKTQQARNALNTANQMIYQAREQSVNESFEPVESDPSWIQVRGSAYNGPVPRFIYPNGPILEIGANV